MRALAIAGLILAALAAVQVAPASTPAPAARHCEDHPQPDDFDCDTVKDDVDNCPNRTNMDQANTDAGYTETDPPPYSPPASGTLPAGDGKGDVCDLDDDADGVADQQDSDGDGEGDIPASPRDNCRVVRNPNQEDTGGQAGVGDACDFDSDADGTVDDRDNCPAAPNRDQADLDGDGAGDVCDGDRDGDGAPNGSDNCPDASNDQTDKDGDGIGAACDPNDIPPAAPPAGTATQDPAARADDSAPAVSLRVPRARDLAGGLPTPVGCDEACGLTARLTVNSRDARRLRTARLLATAEGHLGAAGRTYLIFRLRPRVGSRLRRTRARAVSATVEVTALDASGNRSRVTKRIRFKT